MSWKKNTVNSAAGIEQHILFFFNLLLFSFACVWLMVQDFIFGNVISAHNTVADRRMIMIRFYVSQDVNKMTQ